MSALLGFCLEDAQSVLPVHAERMSSKERRLASSLGTQLPSSGLAASWMAGLFGRTQAEFLLGNESHVEI